MKNDDKKPENKTVFSTPVSSVAKYLSDYKIKSCHVGPVEVLPNFFCGDRLEAIKMTKKPFNVDVLVPLNELGGNVWDDGWRGEILYYPVKDYGALPKDVLDEAVKKICERLKAGKKVGVFCFGGHGRTGYVASCVIGAMMPSIEDPILYLRTIYCQEAVESQAQVTSIAKYLDKPELNKKYKISYLDDWYDKYLLGHFTSRSYDKKVDEYKSYDDYYTKKHNITSFNDIKLDKEEDEILNTGVKQRDVCKDCKRFFDRKCYKHGYFCFETDIACDDFERRKNRKK